MELLKQLYEIHSPSGNETKLLEFLINWLFANLPKADIDIDDSGNLYVTKGESETYPCIVSHVDQVQDNHSDDFEAVETKDIIFGWSNKNKRKEGLGADDKNGVWIALQCLLKYDVIKACFFVSEEIGCLGSDACDMDFFDDCRFVIQCDRRGFGDIINEAGCTELCDDKFLDAIGYEYFGYTKQRGLMTDVMTLKKRGLGVACVNLSCGYYDPHTDDEFTIKYDLMNCLYLVHYIIENCLEVYEHKYKYTPYTYNYTGFKYNGNTSYVPQKKDESYDKCGIQSFYGEDEVETIDVDARDFSDDTDTFNSWVDELEEKPLTEQERDELYDIIFELLNACPSASCDMVYSALLQHKHDLTWKDASAVYHEVKYDMKKYACL